MRFERIMDKIELFLERTWKECKEMDLLELFIYLAAIPFYFFIKVFYPEFF